MTPPLPTPEQWARLVERRGVRDDSGNGCLIWTGSRTAKGYGNFGIGQHSYYAHRTSLAMHLGRPLREGAWACHHCDNPPCFEPTHLYEGDRQSNHRDAFERGRLRGARGAAHHRAKLTEADVLEIRRLRALGARIQPLADQYGLANRTISAIALRRIWKHVA